MHLRLHQFGQDALDEVEAMPDGAARYTAWRILLGRFAERTIGSREIMLLHFRNQTAITALHHNERHHLDHEALEARITRILDSDKLTLEQRVRMACTVGAVSSVFFESFDAFKEVPESERVDAVGRVIADTLGVSTDAMHRLGDIKAP